MSDGKLMKLTKKGKELYPEDIKSPARESCRIIQDSALPIGKAELDIKIIVEFHDNTQEYSTKNESFAERADKWFS